MLACHPAEQIFDAVEFEFDGAATLAADQMMVMIVGAVVGIVGGGILADRFHLKPVLMFLGMMGAIVMSSMGFASNQFLL